MKNGSALSERKLNRGPKNKLFPVEKIREVFPALQLEHSGLPRLYLDNPAGTQVPQPVISAVAEALVEASSNLGGCFPNSRAADEIWGRSHQAMADMLGAESSEEIIIWQSMTALTFHLSRSIGAGFQAGDEIIVTRMDHEGDISPWLHMAEDRGLNVKWLPFDKQTWRIEQSDLESLLTERTRLVALNYASNLTGSINPVHELIATVKSNSEALVYVDAVQFAPHGLVDVQALGCDFLACSSYKFYGPHLGIVWGRGGLLSQLPAYKCRCASDALPEKFELGTPQTELLAGLAAAVDYLAWIGEHAGSGGNRRQKIAAAHDWFGAYEDELTIKLIEGICTIPGTTIYGLTGAEQVSDRVPTVSFTHSRHSPPDIASALAERGIHAWSGHNYAYEVVLHLGLDEDLGVVRLGLAHYNTAEEIDRTLDVLDSILN